MKAALGLLAALLLAGPSISFFKYQREVQTVGSGGQQFVVVDEAIWQHTNPDLNDVRLYSAGKEIPYKLEVERGSYETARKECRVLQPVTVAGKTQFLLDMSGVPEYDRVELTLSEKNFVAHARVEGQDDPHGTRWAALGTSTLYDLSEQKLGHNNALQIPVTVYKYLRVSIDSSVKPSGVQGAFAGITRAQKAVWRAVASGSIPAQQGKNTVVVFSVPRNAPVERVVFEVDPTQVNFRREAEIQGNKGQWLSSDVISRIHMQRNGQKIDVNETSLVIAGTNQQTLRAIIHNGDDLPLGITSARLEQYERRIYFESDLGAQLSLYYGDEKLGPPVYDYSKLFQKSAMATQLQWGPEETNPSYTGRPDERPWSERHPAVLWVAIIAAVLILGVIALKSIQTATA